MDTRRHLVKQATQGYFNDFNRLGDLQGKTWLSPKALIKKERALYFPDIAGTRLDSRLPVRTTDLCSGKISIVALMTTQAADEHVASFAGRSEKLYRDRPNFQYVQINIQENPLKSFLVSLFLSSLRRTIPKHLHPTYIVSHQNMELLRDDIGMVNKHTGYVYLVDEDLKVRWAGCAMPRPEEEDALMRCTEVLLKRLEGPEEGMEVLEAEDERTVPLV